MINNNIVLNKIIDRLIELEETVTDEYIKCAVQANLIKYRKMLQKEKEQIALSIVEYKIKDLTEQLK